MSNLRVGVVNWERTGSSDTYFGHYISRSLSPAKYRHRTPYYADVISENKIAFHKTSQEEYDKELQYAIDAGIGYFAYTWNSDEKENRVDFPCATAQEKENQLMEEENTKRKLHTRSALKDKIKLCAIILCMHKFSDNDMEKLVAEMKEDYYEKIDGRPLVYLFGGYRLDFIERLQIKAEEKGIPKPYIAFCDNGAISENGDYSMADAVSGYSFEYPDCPSYLEFCQKLNLRNEERKKFNINIIPLFSLGYNSRPRMDNPVPWYGGYTEAGCAPLPTIQDMADGGNVFADWMEENKPHMKSRHIIVFAWNEFEEGAWICPTYDDALNIDSSRVKVFSEMVKNWRLRLD